MKHNARGPQSAGKEANLSPTDVKEGVILDLFLYFISFTALSLMINISHVAIHATLQ